MRSAYFLAASSTILRGISGSTWPLQTYHSVNFDATTVNFTKQGAPTNPGYLFISPANGNESQLRAPTIITDVGELIWRAPLTDHATEPQDADGVPSGVNFHPQTVNGTTYVTYWQGDQIAGYGAGYGGVKFLDNTYSQVYNVCVADLDITRVPGTPMTQPCKLDFHESRVTTRGTLLATVRDVRSMDLSPYGGPSDGQVLDSQFVEIDIAQDEVLFRWSAADHIDQLDTMAISRLVKPPGHTDVPWDWFHMNAVAAVDDPIGGYIVSARVPSSVIKLDSDGNVEWYIKGDHTGGEIAPYGGNFTLDDGAGFGFQHDVIGYAESATTLSISMFDNANRIKATKNPSSGLVLDIDTDSMTATLGRRLSAANNPIVHHIGSTQLLDNGHALVDFGDPPQLNEFDADGNVIYQALVSSPGAGSTYRAYKLPWVGMPSTQPDLVSSINLAKRTTQIYMSWNGATEYTRWQISVGLTPDTIQRLKKVAKKGFETGALLKGTRLFVQVAALGPDGSTLGTSDVVQSTVS